MQFHGTFIMLTRSLSLVLAFSATVLLFGSCKPRSQTATQQTLRITMVPTTDPCKVIRESQPLVSYLEKETGAKIQLTVPTNYAAAVEAIVSDQVDIAYLGGFTYVQASKRAGVVPLVQRDRDQNFHSLFITQPDSPIRTLQDLAGHSFAFGDVNSTSGHLMPKFFMREAGVDSTVFD